MNTIIKLVSRFIAHCKVEATYRSFSQASKHIHRLMDTLPEGQKTSVALNRICNILGCGNDGLVWGAIPHFAVDINYGRQLVERNKNGERVVSVAYAQQ